MNKETLENNLKKIIGFYNEVNAGLNNIYSGVKENNESRVVLEDFLEYLGLDNSEKTRLVAYFRLVDLKENPLVLYLENNNFSEKQIEEKLDLAYEYVSEFHFEVQTDIISFIEEKNLVSEFYLEIFKGVHGVGKAFNDFFLPWRNHIVNGVNKDLEKRFENDSDKIMNFLNENKLFDLGHSSELADRSYSALVPDEEGNYISKSYREVFGYEIGNIIKSLENFISKLEDLEDEIYNSKKQYLDYLNAIKNAFEEKEVNNLVEKWAEVDNTWMQIKTPFQIGHPLEFYEDKYRKAVAPEWDLRIGNEVFKSVVEDDIENMYEELYNEIDRDKYKSSYKFSKANIKRVQLYLTSPVLYYSSELTGMFSAQVVPNDEVISDKEGKKIFAFPEMVMENKRSMPFMKLSSVIFEEKLLDSYRSILFSDSKNFYKIYDIETIGHEFGHTLWLDLDTESTMNSKTGVFKNIEEFKATTGGLVAYFMKESHDLDLAKKLVVFHVMRSVGLIAYKKVTEIQPYYCEALIHLDILFESGIINLNSENKIELVFDEEIYNNLKSCYIKHYKKLINTYLEKIDALEFLSDYTTREGIYYLPIDEKIKDFVNYFYETYEKLGNEVDEEISKDKYRK